MKVSVLLPTYNQAKHLPAALDALDKQTFRDFELIACDDGSTDETADILNGRCWVVTHSENKGTAEAINSARVFARGQYITWVSSDNVMHSDWLARLHCEVNGYGAVYSAYHCIEGESQTKVRQGVYDRSRLIESENCYFGPSFLIDARVWQSHRGGSSHDYDNWARVEEACWAKMLGIRYIDEVLCDYHRGEWNTCRRRPDLYDADHWRAEALKRRA